MIPSIAVRRMRVRLGTAVYCLGACAALAQTTIQDDYDLGSRFANVLIKAHDERRIPAMFVDTKGHWIMRGTPLTAVIGQAYGMREFQIVDGPDWIRTSGLYDIEAIPPPRELVTSDSTRMLRNLLADRFKLEMDTTTRDMTMLALEFVKATPALRLTETSRFQLPPGTKEFLLFNMKVTPPGAPHRTASAG